MRVSWRIDVNVSAMGRVVGQENKPTLAWISLVSTKRSESVTPAVMVRERNPKRMLGRQVMTWWEHGLQISGEVLLEMLKVAYEAPDELPGLASRLDSAIRSALAKNSSFSPSKLSATKVLFFAFFSQGCSSICADVGLDESQSSARSHEERNSPRTRIFREAQVDKLFHGLAESADSTIKRRSSFHHRTAQDVIRLVPRPRSRSVSKLEQSDSKTPDIGFGIIFLAHDDLGGHPTWLKGSQDFATIIRDMYRPFQQSSYASQTPRDRSSSARGLGGRWKDCLS